MRNVLDKGGKARVGGGEDKGGGAGRARGRQRDDARARQAKLLRRWEAVVPAVNSSGLRYRRIYGKGRPAKLSDSRLVFKDGEMTKRGRGSELMLVQGEQAQSGVLIRNGG